VAVVLLVVGLEKFAFGVVLGKPRRNDDDLGEHVTGVVHALGEDPSKYSENQMGISVGQGIEDLPLVVIGGSGLLDQQPMGCGGQAILDGIEEFIAWEECEDVLVRVRESGDPVGDSVVVRGAMAVCGVHVVDAEDQPVFGWKRRRHKEFIGAMRVESKQVPIEFEWLESGRHGHHSGTLVQHPAHKT